METKFIPFFDNLIDIADNLSIAFQIRDDVLNITPSTLSKGKGFLGEDIFEGKLTLMVLHTLNSKTEGSKKEKLKEILMMKTKDEGLIKEAIEILERNGSVNYANEVMNFHVEKVKEKCEELSRIGKENFKGEVAYDINGLMEFLINRNI